MSKKLYTNETLFNTIANILREKNLLPDILDYDLSDRDITEIRSYEWDCSADLRFGGSEGIYLDVYVKGDLGRGKSEARLGVFKTLGESREDFYTMAKLQADFLWEMRAFVNKNIDDFEWTGYNVDFFRDNKKTMGYSTARNMDRVDNLIERNKRYDWDYVVITDNETCKKTRVERRDMVLD